MHFSEDDLKHALRRKNPGPGFTQRVMVQINRLEETRAAERSTSQNRSRERWVWRLRPALVTALAAVLLIAGGLGYQQYERVQARRRLDAQHAELAKQQMMLALQITNVKLNHVFRRISGPSGEGPKIRRQSL